MSKARYFCGASAIAAIMALGVSGTAYAQTNTANEVEEVVGRLDGIMECAVVGVADEKTGEAVKLVIVKKDQALTEEKVREYCRANLTGYKQPKVVEFRTDMPKTPVGKILRRELRDKK